MTAPKVDRIVLEMDKLETIVEHARSALSDEEHRQLKGVLNTLAQLTQELEKKRTSIDRLRDLLFGPRTEKTAAVLNQRTSKSSSRKIRKAQQAQGAWAPWELVEGAAQWQAQLDPPIQMCDALSRNVSTEFATILSNCMSHGRRKFDGMCCKPWNLVQCWSGGPIATYSRRSFLSRGRARSSVDRDQR